MPENEHFAAEVGPFFKTTKFTKISFPGNGVHPTPRESHSVHSTCSPKKAVRSADSALQAGGLRGGRKHRVTPLTSRALISLSPVRPLSILPTSIQSRTIASPLPCAIELNFSNFQHTHPASATERACDDSLQFSWFSLVFPARVAMSTASSV